MALPDRVHGLVHEPTQSEGRGLDLTVASVSRVVGRGQVDFGGGELAEAEVEPVDPERRVPDDDYGWWTLTSGVYLVGYNESLGADGTGPLLLQTRREVRARGAFHPTVVLDPAEDLGPVPMVVGDGGIDLKENARVSTLRSPT